MGELRGKCLMPRDGASFLAPYFSGVALVKGTATMGSESDFFVGAVSDLYKDGYHDSGLMQIHELADSKRDLELRTDSLDEKVWRPIAEANAKAAHDLYHDPWVRNGKQGIREWEPWYGYTPGWATFPEWWIWSHNHETWLPTGRYVQRAIPGVANYHLVIKKDLRRPSALEHAKKWQETFKVKGDLGIAEGIVAWTNIPGKPSSPPADGVGPRPVPNDGR